MTRNTLFNSMLTVAGLAAFAGCQSNDGMMHGETFHTSEQTTAIGRFAQAQSAAGAKADSVLYDRHFTGNELNSLGQSKLDLILKASPLNEPVKLYLVMPHDTIAMRETSVTAYLDKAGVTAADTQYAEGPNPANTTPSEYNLAGIYQVGKDNYSGAAADGAGAGGK